jgi:hydrophobic/amphiphilic exporter-1 (mainly G- bacteria), HAE1 family
VVPLVIADGAGAAGQQALGTAVFGGMLASTILAVFFVPVFFFYCQSLSEWFKPRTVVEKGAVLAEQVPPAIPTTQSHAAH